jgi:hypothetical protein
MLVGSEPVDIINTSFCSEATSNRTLWNLCVNFWHSKLKLIYKPPILWAKIEMPSLQEAAYLKLRMENFGARRKQMSELTSP